MVEQYTREQLLELTSDQIRDAFWAARTGMEMAPGDLERYEAIRAGIVQWAGSLGICEYGALVCTARYRNLSTIRKAAVELEAAGLLVPGGAHRTALGDAVFRVRKELKSEFLIEPGMKVYPRSRGGLQLAEKPASGNYPQASPGPYVLRGLGVVEEVHDVVIDYDTWPEPYRGEGKINYRSCLVRTEEGVLGWAGEGALVLSVEDQL